MVANGTPTAISAIPIAATHERPRTNSRIHGVPIFRFYKQSKSRD
jgi:hypothetical protein